MGRRVFTIILVLNERKWTHTKSVLQIPEIRDVSKHTPSTQGSTYKNGAQVKYLQAN